MNVLDLTGLPVEDAVSLARRKLERSFALAMAYLEIVLINDGVNRDTVDAMLEYRRTEFEVWGREDLLSELRSWLVECNRKLH